MIEVGLNPIQSEAKAYFFLFFFSLPITGTVRGNGKPLKLKMNCITLSFKKFEKGAVEKNRKNL